MERICSLEQSSNNKMSLNSPEDLRPSRSDDFRTTFIGDVINFLEVYCEFREGVCRPWGGTLFSAVAIAFLRNFFSSFVGIRSSTFIIVVSLRAGFRKTIIRELSLPFCRFLLRLECLRIPAPPNDSLSLLMMHITADSFDRVEAV